MSASIRAAAADFDREAWAADARRLHAALAELAPEAVTRWAPTVRHADGSLTNAGPLYPDELLALWPLLERAGVTVTPVDYLSWGRSNPRFAFASHLAQAPLEDVATWFVSLRRAERFCDGAWGAALTEGRLLPALARLIALVPELPYDGARSPWASARKAAS